MTESPETPAPEPTPPEEPGGPPPEAPTGPEEGGGEPSEGEG
jgi:hypothetical protein